MKKFITALLLVILSAGISSAEVVGILSKSNTSQEKFSEKIVPRNDASSQTELAKLFAEGVSERSYRFYDSFSLLMLALSKGEIDSIAVPELVGEYMVRKIQQYHVR